MNMYAFEWWILLIGFVLVTTHLSSLAVSLYLHREYTHDAIMLRPITRSFFRFIIWFQTGMVPAEWVVVHKKHHSAPADGPDDPHSPVNHGKWRIVLFGVIYYVRACRKYRSDINRELEKRPDIISNRLIKPIGVILNLCLHVFLWGWVVGPLVWMIQCAWIPFWAAGVINGLGHSAEDAHTHTRDYSRNIFENGPKWVRILLSIITAGESNHHNHHLKPSASNFAFEKKRDFDWGFVVIKLLRKVGLVAP